MIINYVLWQQIIYQHIHIMDLISLSLRKYLLKTMIYTMKNHSKHWVYNKNWDIIWYIFIKKI